MSRQTKVFLLLTLSFLAAPIVSRAQGGIGNMPRQDIVMLRAAARDSIADEIWARIMDLKRYAENDQLDSAAAIIAYNGTPTKEGKWARSVNLSVPEEKAYAEKQLAKVKALFAAYPDWKREYFACFKDKDNPYGQKHLYQIHHVNGSKQKMVSWTFYPIGEKIMLGDFS